MDNKIRVKIIPIYGNIEKLLDIDFDIFKSSVLDRSLIRMDVIGGDNQLSNLRKSHYLNDKYEEIHTSSPDDIQNICKTCNYKSGCDYYHRLRDNKNGEMMCYNNSFRKECKMQISEFVDTVSRDKLEYLMDVIDSMHKLID